MTQLIFNLQIFWYRVLLAIAPHKSCFNCKYQDWETWGDGWNEPYGEEWCCSYQDRRQDLNDIYEHLMGEIDDKFAMICDTYTAKSEDSKNDYE